MVRYRYQVIACAPACGGSPVWDYTNTANVVSGIGHLNVQTVLKPLPDATYEYRLAAIDSSFNQQGAWSAWSPPFRVDTVHPHLPRVTSSSFTMYQTVPATSVRAGTSGTAGQITLSPNSAGGAHETDIYEYVYSTVPGPVTNPPACTPATSPVTAGGVTVVCKLGADHTGTGSLTPFAPTNTVFVESLDLAGNISDVQDGTHNALLASTYFVNDRSLSLPSHAWLDKASLFGDPANPVLPKSVPDWSGASPALPMALGPQASWYIPPGQFNGPHEEALAFSGVAGSSAQTAAIGSVASSATSFSAVVWAQPSNGSVAASQTVLSQDGSATSAFRISETAADVSGVSHWQFCMPQSQAATPVLDCVVSPLAADPFGFTLLVASWNANSQTITLHVGAPAMQTPPVATIASHRLIAPAVNGAVTLGKALAGSQSTSFFSGYVSDPLIYSIVLSDAQVNSLALRLPTGL